jgi:hypothetical protein
MGTKIQRAVGVGAPFINVFPIPIHEQRAPTTTDDQYPPGQEWFDDSQSPSILYQYVGNGIWNASSSTSGVSTLTGNTGTASPASGNIAIVGIGAVSVAGSGSTLTISATIPASFTWNDNATSLTMVSNNGYLVKSASQQSFTLPTTAALGDLIEIVWVSGAGGFRITQSAGQQIRYSGNLTTAGATGTLTSSSVGNTVHLVCTTAGASSFWVVDFNQGPLTAA